MEPKNSIQSRIHLVIIVNDNVVIPHKRLAENQLLGNGKLNGVELQNVLLVKGNVMGARDTILHLLVVALENVKMNK